MTGIKNYNPLNFIGVRNARKLIIGKAVIILMRIFYWFGQDWGNPWANDMESFMKKLPNVQEDPLADYMDGNRSITDAHLIKLFKEICHGLSAVQTRAEIETSGHLSKPADHVQLDLKSIRDLSGAGV